MAACLDLGTGSVPYGVQVVAVDPANLAACSAACPTGHICQPAGLGSLLPPELEAGAIVEAVGAGMAIIGIPLAAAFGFAVVLSMLRR